ncbi:MAG: DUF2062 domain-containing protein [Hyphomicrobiales bacterium]|nr:DUF2062 domain-containing protein [Hyphomicrobiales bacterium]
MLFRRRKRPSFAQRVRVAVWPRRSWARSFKYFGLRLSRTGGSPHKVALGFAAGVFAIVTPFLGFQMIIAAVLAWCLRGSVFASAVGSFVGNPISYPLIWVSTYKLGNQILGDGAVTGRIDFQGKAEAVWNGMKRLSWDAVSVSLEAFWPILKPMAIGSIPLGAAAAIVSYFGMRKLIETTRQNSGDRMKLKTI